MSSENEIERIKEKKLLELIQSTTSKTPNENNGKPIILTDQTFHETISKQPIMVVDFWAAWCGPCRLVSPIIEQLAQQYAGKVTFGKLNVDENPVVSNTFRIQSIPTLLIFKNGKPIDGLVGAAPKQFIESKIKSHIPNN